MAGNELSLELYADAFRSLHPKLAHSLLFERIRQAKLLNEELSEHFRERISIEEQYIRALTKLAKKPISTAASNQNSHAPQSAQFKYNEQDEEQHQDAHGRVAKILQDQLTHSISSHENYHAQLQTQVEAALRKPLLQQQQQQAGAQQDEAEFRSTEEQTLKLVKSYEESEQKLNRSTQKLNSSSNNLRKIQSLQTRQYEDQLHFNHAKQTWGEHASHAFRVYQSVDKQRLMDLFETLTKFETIQADHSRQLMEIAERATISLLTFDIQENMQRFALINGSIADPSTTTTTTTTTATHPNGNQPEQQQQQQTTTTTTTTTTTEFPATT
ncbi:hypothetical protein PCANC_25475 [Puccinia coronata f. sp. avenae]|uniref:FCH domain-containing protein n=1 Tax=Puccinia coronata f. sp. avenae TaxID=200324 RepID=A0A2N5TI17_9BASI|nr:hypothetical protein PCANC_25475 [Puccinia coronata f. sp. avenae]